MEIFLRPKSGFQTYGVEMADEVVQREGFKDYVTIYVYLELYPFLKIHGWLRHASGGTEQDNDLDESPLNKKPRYNTSNLLVTYIGSERVVVVSEGLKEKMDDVGNLEEEVVVLFAEITFLI